MGKGEIMPKRNRKTKKLHLSENEKLLVKLHSISRRMGENSETARGLMSWYMTHKEWSYRQLCLVRRLCNSQSILENHAVEAKKKYNLYAFSDGESIKIGISTHIGKRMRAVLTGHPKRLNCVWRFYTGTCRAHGYKMEKKLQRLCKQNKLVGEWFKIEALDQVKEFACEKVNTGKVTP